MNLKTDYKNDIFSGKRKYHMTNNDDGTISLDDVTTYVQEGDILSADDVNATNKAVNELRTGSDSFQEEITEKVKAVSETADALTGEALLTFKSSGWSDTAPYTQKVTFAGIKEKDIRHHVDRSKLLIWFALDRHTVKCDGRSPETCMGLRRPDCIGKR